MSNRIPLRDFVGVDGRPLRVPKLDNDGEFVWKNPCPECGKPKEGTAPEMMQATTAGTLRLLLLNIPPAVHRKEDSRRAAKVLNAVSRAVQKSADLVLGEEDYEWIHRVMDRKLPKGKAEDLGEEAEEMTVGDAIWNVSAWAVAQQLKPKGLVFDDKGGDSEDASVNGSGSTEGIGDPVAS